MPNEERSLRRTRSRWDIIKADHNKKECDNIKWINLSIVTNDGLLWTFGFVQGEGRILTVKECVP